MTGEDQEITDEINPEYQENNETLIYYACAMCPANFEKKSSLFGHFTAMHEKTKKFNPFKCSICGGGFTQKKSMQVHIATVDEGQKPFKCSICDDSFTHIGSMKRHIATNHEGQKAFKCHKFLSFFSTKWIFFNILTQCHQVIHAYCNNS